jgi:hypothetical protein
MRRKALAWCWRAGLSWARRRRRPLAHKVPVDIETVRGAMQAMLHGAAATDAPRLARSLRLAHDLEGLWHLRPALMHAVAAERGESLARRGIAAIDSLFVQGWPAVPVSRPGALV